MTVTTTHLGKVVDVSAGQPAPKPTDFSEDGYPFIRAGSLEGLLSGLTEDDCEKIDAQTARRYRMRLYPRDTIVFAKSGMSAKIGRVYRMRQSAYVVSHLAALAPIGKYEPSYLVHWLRAHPPSKLIKDDSYPSIRTSEVSALEVPDLHIDEQRRIAAILDKADSIRRKRQQALTLANDFLKSVFLEMFGDLSTNARNWQTKTIGQILELEPQNGLYRHSSDYGTGTQILRIDGFYDGYLSTEREMKRLAIDPRTVKTYQLTNGDIVMNRVNSPEYLGKCALIEGLTEPTVFESNMMRFRVDAQVANPRFIVDQLRSGYVKTQIAKAAKPAVNQSSINQKDVTSFEVRLPPLESQNQYSELVAAKINADNGLQSALSMAVSLIESLSQRAFRGDL
jgi:type I restriction enzyme S subunit